METGLRPLAVSALAALVLTGCVGLEPGSDVEPGTDPEDQQSGPSETGAGEGGGDSGPDQSETDPAELTYEELDADQIEYLLLDEDDWPYALDSFEQEEGDPFLSEYYAEWAEYWIPLDGIDYTSEAQDCFDGIAALEEIESDGGENVFVGGLRDNPNVSYGEDVIMTGASSFGEEQDTAAVWEEVHRACDGVEIEEDGDVVSLSAIEQGSWNGVHMAVQAGSFFEQDLYFDDIFLATLDRGENIVYAVGMDVPSGTFTDVLRAQERRLDEGLPEDLDDGREDDDGADDGADEDEADQDRDDQDRNDQDEDDDEDEA
ncbi:hypothetical protein ACFP47_02885 [Nesterenkonia lacusekhoensis]|uniref:Lipoprotein n=1 Tax=Nesterenkonia lacusekhoensis TaxID=150832 RepID=A0ABS4T505_9MICC|nr:hypothetical protein [Nesterenkonia lacusekhoensis]MBP2318968.1 hypothetical protein [Nesterenkonia lacusekhoensis]